MRFVLSVKFREETGGIVLETVSRDDFSPRAPSSELAAESYSLPLLQFFTSLCLSCTCGGEGRNFTFPLLPLGQDGEDEILIGNVAEVRERLNQLHRNAVKDKEEGGQKGRRKAKEQPSDPEKQPHWARNFLWVKQGDKELPILDFPRGKNEVKLKSVVERPEVAIEFRGQPLTGAEHLKAFLRLISLLQHPADRELLRYRGVRENLNYNVTFTDSILHDGLHQRFQAREYQYYKAHITFDRISPRQLDKFTIGLNNTEADLSESIAERGIIYREVFDFLPNDREVFNTLMTRAVMAGTAEERTAALSGVLKVSARVNGDVATLESVSAAKSGYHLQFALPPSSRGRLFLKFDLELFGFQPRSLHRFPIVISEPTRKADFTFAYGDAAIENVDCFVGCSVTPNGTRARGKIDSANRTFWLSRERSEFFSPGEGAVVFWTPVQRVDWVELVELGEFDKRFIIDPPYATENNFFKKKLYPSKRLFLVKETAKKLVAVQERLERDNTGFLLRIWDAYRPPSVQRQMWKVIQQEEYVAHPAKGSVHNRGCAIDVTLAHADGDEVPMPTPYDDFSEAAHPKTILQGEAQATRNFRTLLHYMEEAGFEVWATEWWHFNDRDWRKYPVLDIEAYEKMLKSSLEPHQ